MPTSKTALAHGVSPACCAVAVMRSLPCPLSLRPSVPPPDETAWEVPCVALGDAEFAALRDELGRLFDL